MDIRLSLLKTVFQSDPEDVAVEFLPEARPITWKAGNGSTVHGLYHPPSNPEQTSPGLPPAIVHIHGGPTSATPAEYSAETAFFTSRGWAWLDVNHRGSTGYGHKYESMLRQRWGDVDTEDALGAAEALDKQKLADGRRLVILGGSAGGYTVLNALIRQPGRFRAGVCLYGVSNLFTLELDTHKFESHYNATLVGSLPEDAKKFHDWSPVFHAARIRDSLAIFQGEDDQVIPPSQSEELVQALKANQVPHLYKVYAGEGHGFRKNETIQDYLTQTERFLQQEVLFGTLER